MRTLYPYPTLIGAVVIRRLEAWVTTEEGEKKLSSSYVDPERLDVLLAQIGENDWEEARLHVVVDVPIDEITTTQEWTDERAILVAECVLTNERVTTRLDRDDARGSRWSGEVVLSRSACYGRGTLRAVVTATVDGIRNRPLGTSESWSVDFDELPPNPVHGSIAVTWMRFKEPSEDRLYLKRYAKDPWFLTLEPLAPTLYLNLDFPGLPEVLDDSARLRRADTAVRDTLRAGLAAQVWQSMFMYSLAAAEIDEETEEVQAPPEEWQRSVLSTLLPRMYPGRPDSDALREARASLASADSLGVLQQLLIPAATEQAQAPRLIGDSLKRLAREVVQTAEEV